MSASRLDRLRELREVLGPECSVDTADFELDGRHPETLFSPENEDALAAILSGLSERGLAALIRGGGSHLRVGNPPSEADCVISTERLVGIRHFEPDDGVIEVAAGTPIATLREAVSDSGWEIPLDVPGACATVGGVIATARAGPRNLGWGPVRRAVLGLEVVLASGERTRCGGRVVKNVTGYDLAKLYTGSFGTLGVISSAWLRLQPRPHAIEVRVAEFSETAAAMKHGIAASRRTSSRACALLSPGAARKIGLTHSLAATWLLVAEFAGETAECLEDARWAEKALGAEAPTTAPDVDVRSWIDAIATLAGEAPAADGVRARIGLLPSKLEGACAPLAHDDTELVVLPGLGVVHALFPGQGFGDEGREAVNRAVASAERSARSAHGNLLFESLPLFAKEERDVFDDCGAAVPIMRSLKREFDPEGVLNPGRFAGGI